jgi:hypothetical protein
MISEILFDFLLYVTNQIKKYIFLFFNLFLNIPYNQTSPPPEQKVAIGDGPRGWTLVQTQNHLRI